MINNSYFLSNLTFADVKIGIQRRPNNNKSVDFLNYTCFKSIVSSDYSADLY